MVASLGELEVLSHHGCTPYSGVIFIQLKAFLKALWEQGALPQHDWEMWQLFEKEHTF